MCFSFYEIAHAQRKFVSRFFLAVVFQFSSVNEVLDAFIRDELSKGRYDPAISKICFEMLLELFGRTLKLDLGSREGGEQKVEDVC